MKFLLAAIPHARTSAATPPPAHRSENAFKQLLTCYRELFSDGGDQTSWFTY